MFSEYSTNVPYSGSVTSRTATLHPLVPFSTFNIIGIVSLSGLFSDYIPKE